MQEDGKSGLSAGQTATLLRLGGLAVWVATGARPMFRLIDDPSRLGTSLTQTWCLSFALFGLAFWLTTGAIGRWKTRYLLLGVGIQAVVGLAMFSLVCTGFESALLVVVAAQLALLATLRVGLIWLAIQGCVMFTIGLKHWGLAETVQWVSLAFGGQLFAFFLASIGRRERVLKERLASVNADLREAQKRLAQTTRTEERLQISRELHDVLGHGLTALSLNLEAAKYSPKEVERAELLNKSQTLSKELLADVRSVVSEIRRDDDVPLDQEIQALQSKINQPVVHADIADNVSLNREARHALLRCVQEAITNSCRHSRAANFWIRLHSEAGRVRMEMTDDGGRATAIRPGNGLQGIKERMLALQGDACWEATQAGFKLTVSVPTLEASS